jgi:hypothetical protein
MLLRPPPEAGNGAIEGGLNFFVGTNAPNSHNCRIWMHESICIPDIRRNKVKQGAQTLLLDLSFVCGHVQLRSRLGVIGEPPDLSPGFEIIQYINSWLCEFYVYSAEVSLNSLQTYDFVQCRKPTLRTDYALAFSYLCSDNLLPLASLV